MSAFKYVFYRYLTISNDVTYAVCQYITMFEIFDFQISLRKVLQMLSFNLYFGRFVYILSSFFINMH